MKNRILDGCVFLLIYHTVLTWNNARSESLHQNGFDHVAFLNPPMEPVSSYRLRVLYSCSASAVVHLEALISSDVESAMPVFERHWSCEPGPSRVRSLILNFPDWLVYRADWKIPESEWVLGGMLRAWIVADGSPDEYSAALARSLVLVQPLHPDTRPLKQHQLCPSWDTEMMWKIRKDFISRCPLELEVTHFLPVLHASTGEKFGITRTLGRFSSKVLERRRVKAISYPWCVFSTWLFLTQPCRQKLCGVLYRLNSQNSYASPSLFLTDSGHLQVQVDLVSGMSSAFRGYFSLPVQQWCRLTLELQGPAVNVSAVCVGDQRPSAWSANHVFREPVKMDDTDGSFVLGGSPFLIGFEGFYGPTVYYRNRVPLLMEMDKISILQADLAVEMSEWFRSCQEFKQELQSKLTGFSQRIKEQEQAGSCPDLFNDWTSRGALSVTTPQCELWERPTLPRRRYTVRLARRSLARHGDSKSQLTWVGGVLYSTVMRRLTQGGRPETVRRVMPRLLQSGCLGDNHALYLSSVLYSAGLGVRRKTNKARLLSLLAAQHDWRLALLRLGHLHHLGNYGVPADLGLAYAYYANIASQTSEDIHTPTPEQQFVEMIYLTNEEVLKQQTSQTGDLFLWLKHQARNGAAEAERAVARMLFWGQQGVSPNIEMAARHYERGATRLEDPSSMYNYAIVLLQGQGVEKDVPKAVKYLKKAVDQNFVRAMTALGWYYEHFERDFKRAVELWERADSLGCGEAAANLGTMHSQGLYPGKPASQFVAYTYYLKAAKRGHITGAIRLAEVWNRGISGQVKRLPLDAVLWAKWASEQNGYLGMVLRKALDAYFQRDWFTALIYYLMAAEAGFAAAQFNLAYLCEHNSGGLLEPAFVTDCMLRYYNLSIESQDTPTYALIRLGDLIHGSGKRSRRDVTSAAELYKKAVLKNDPQGWYSLGVLVQEGHALPGSVLAELDLWALHGADNHTILTTLYTRCRDHESREAYYPCSLAVFCTQLQSVWKHHANLLKVSSAVIIAAVTFLMVGRFRLRPSLSIFHGV